MYLYPVFKKFVLKVDQFIILIDLCNGFGRRLKFTLAILTFIIFLRLLVLQIMNRTKPYLSIVSVSRNDEHGGHLLERMQIFIDSLNEQCNRYQLETELIIVEWNPPENKKMLHEVIQWPDNRGFLTTRIIQVPNTLHSTFKNSDRIPLFQMIGKNVGIRRSRGEFILATNIDILFSDELMEYISKKKLRKNVLYRVDRLDASSPFTGIFRFFGRQPSAVMREFCRVNTIRVNKKYGTLPAGFTNNNIRAYLLFLLNKLRFHYTGKIPFYGVIHANGCGDFTLMSQELWLQFCGYPELPIFSWNIDSLLLIFAYHDGIQEIDLKQPKNIFHIEHGSGSGWTPGEGEKLLFKKIEENQIPVFTWEDCIAASRMLKRMRKRGVKMDTKTSDWGLASCALEEMVIN
jgi:hypothetical protein